MFHEIQIQSLFVVVDTSQQPPGITEETTAKARNSVMHQSMAMDIKREARVLLS
jgi:hypothetical protein